jgi:hypothetical protein
VQSPFELVAYYTHGSQVLPSRKTKKRQPIDTAGASSIARRWTKRVAQCSRSAGDLAQRAALIWGLIRKRFEIDGFVRGAEGDMT